MHSQHHAAYLGILEEIKNDLPWLIQVWLKIRGAPDKSVVNVDIPAQGEFVFPSVDTSSSSTNSPVR